MDESAAASPFVSIIVPCRNEARHIERFLRSMLQCGHPQDRLEIFLVDGMSTDGTRDAIARAAGALPFVRVLDNPARIVPVAMNLAIKQARGEYIVRMDAHSEYPDNYVPRVLKMLRETGAGNAGGRVVIIPNGEGPWAAAVSYVTAHFFGVGNGTWRIGGKPGFVDTVPNGAYPREVLDKVGLYDERLTRNQDNELNSRLHKHGYRIAFDPSLQVRYYNQADLRGLLHQGFFTAMWNVYTLYLHPYTWKWRRFVPAAFVAYLAAAAAVVATGPAPLAAAALLPLALYAVLLAFSSAGAGPRDGGPLRAAATFTSYHLAYGLGTFFGLANLLTGRWRRYMGRPLRR